MASSPQSAEILVVEDDDAIRLVLCELLEDEGYHVHEAVNGLAALDYLRQAAVKPCLILLDLMMPTMTGWEFRRAQREDTFLREIPVIVVSALGQRLEAAQRADLEAAEYLSKPIDWNSLIRAVHHWCDLPPA